MEDKFEKDFEAWLLEWIKVNLAREGEIPNKEDVAAFYTYPDSMKWGVYVDFLLEHNIYVHNLLSSGKFSVYVDCNGHHLLTTYLIKDSLEEAREAALEKAKKIYNQTTEILK